MPNRPHLKVVIALARIAFLCVCGGFGATAARADIYVVVHPENPQRSMSQKEVVDLFMGRSRSFSDGETAIALDLPRENAVRHTFYGQLTGMTPAQLASYWAHLTVGGAVMPPQVLDGQADVARLVKRNPNAIGYLSLDREPLDKGLRIVFVMKEGR